MLRGAMPFAPADPGGRLRGSRCRLRGPAHLCPHSCGPGNGIVEVDLLSRLSDGAPDYARAFAGLAYRIIENLESFEAVYVRPLNGAKVDPPGPRAQRAVQYFAYPEWNFERLREEYPDGRYESGAHIGPDEWIQLRVEVQDGRLRASVDGIQILDLAETKGREALGGIGLFVDIGTEAFFSNLSITAR